MTIRDEAVDVEAALKSTSPVEVAEVLPRRA